MTMAFLITEHRKEHRIIKHGRGVEALPCFVEVTGFSSQLSNSPPDCSPKFSQQQAARKIGVRFKSCII